MANDRLILRCEKCDARKVLAAYWPGNDPCVGVPRDITEFLHNHLLYCYGLHSDLGEDSPITLWTEAGLSSADNSVQ